MPVPLMLAMVLAFGLGLPTESGPLSGRTSSAESSRPAAARSWSGSWPRSSAP